MSISCLRRPGHLFGWLCLALVVSAVGASQAAAQSASRTEKGDPPPVRDSEHQADPRDALRRGVGFGMPPFGPRAPQASGGLDEQMHALERILEMPLLKRHIELVEENARLKAQLELQEQLRHMQREHGEQGERAAREAVMHALQASHLRDNGARDRRGERPEPQAEQRERAEHREHAEQRERMAQQLHAENEMLRQHVRELEARLHDLQSDMRAKVGGDREGPRGQDARPEEARREESRREQARREEARRGAGARGEERRREQARDDDDDDEEDEDDDEEDDDDDDDDEDDDDEDDDDDRE